MGEKLDDLMIAQVSGVINAHLRYTIQLSWVYSIIYLVLLEQYCLRIVPCMLMPTTPLMLNVNVYNNINPGVR